jgi:hypothetical protein
MRRQTTFTPPSVPPPRSTTWLDSSSPLACLLVGQPTLRRKIKLGVLAALDQ